MPRTTSPQPGDIRTWNFQSDVYGGRYQLVRHLGGQKWEAVRLEPSDEEIDLILNDKWGGTDEQKEATVLRRIEDAGTTFQLRLVSSDEWARYF